MPPQGHQCFLQKTGFSAAECLYGAYLDRFELHQFLPIKEKPPFFPNLTSSSFVAPHFCPDVEVSASRETLRVSYDSCHHIPLQCTTDNMKAAHAVETARSAAPHPTSDVQLACS